MTMLFYHPLSYFVMSQIYFSCWKCFNGSEESPVNAAPSLTESVLVPFNEATLAILIKESVFAAMKVAQLYYKRPA